MSLGGGRRRLFIYDLHSDRINDHHDEVKISVSQHINDDGRYIAGFYRNEEAKCSEMHGL